MTFMKWKYFPRYWPFVRGIHRSPVNSPHKGQWRRALMFSLICEWINSWVNNRVAVDLRRHGAHYDLIVMFCFSWLATTKFQPTDARKAFPNFDEPHYKATYTVTLRHWSNFTALSNMPVHVRNNYRQISNIRCTKSQTLNVSCLVMQLSLSNPLKAGIKTTMKM